MPRTVTITLSKVAVEHPQPRALVRNSKRSCPSGQAPGLNTGSRRLEAGTQVALCPAWSAEISIGSEQGLTLVSNVHEGYEVVWGVADMRRWRVRRL